MVLFKCYGAFVVTVLLSEKTSTFSVVKILNIKNPDVIAAVFNYKFHLQAAAIQFQISNR